MQALRLVSAIFLAPLAAAIVVGLVLIVTSADMSGQQPDGKYIPTLPVLMAPVYLVALVLSIPAYFVLSRMKWTSLWQIVLMGAVPIPVAMICLAFAVTGFSTRTIVAIPVVALAGGAWGFMFWWIMFRPRETSSSFPKEPLRREF